MCVVFHPGEGGFTDDLLFDSEVDLDSREKERTLSEIPRDKSYLYCIARRSGLRETGYSIARLRYSRIPSTTRKKRDYVSRAGALERRSPDSADFWFIPPFPVST